jgi:hypothetical protein
MKKFNKTNQLWITRSNKPFSSKQACKQTRQTNKQTKKQCRMKKKLKMQVDFSDY